MFYVKPFDVRTLSWWFAERDTIDMDPPYQRRGGLWSTSDKAYLIDSIINRFDIPKLYIADFTYANTPLNVGRRPYAIIDGRQRFEAIFDFFESKIALNRDFQYVEDPALALGGLGYKDLQKNYPRIAQRFENFNLTVMSVITDDASKINEMFVRLNRNKPLTGAEVRNAMRGVIPPLLRDLADHAFFADRIKFATRRRQDLNVAAKFLLVEFRGRFVDTKKVHLDRFVAEATKSETMDVETTARRVRRVLDRMAEIFLSKDPLLSSEGPLIVYYWFVRSRAKDEIGLVHPFLVDFEDTRKRVVTLDEKATTPKDRLYLAYQAARRNINDHSSMIARHRILEEAWGKYLKKARPASV
jgi:hypothetical protein